MLPTFIIQVAVIIVLANLVGIVTGRLKQPMVIAEIVAGILLGPSVLGWIWPSASAMLFPERSLSVLNLMSQMGLIMYLFVVGLEFDPKTLRGRGQASVLISHTSILVPFALGSLLGLYLYPRLAPPSVALTSFVLFMGIAMSITAFPVLARILSDRRLTRTKIGAISLACAAVDDVTAWCLLAFVVSIARATGMAQAVRTTVLALIYVLTMLLVVRPLLKRVGSRVNNVKGIALLLLASSLVTEWIGIHALFGAFVFGMILPKDDERVQAAADKFQQFVVAFLLPMFFAYSGLRTKLGTLDTASAWLICILVTVVACVGKFGGSALAARATGLTWRESSAIGILMNTRGLMELVVLNIGLDLGVISVPLFTIMVVMALVTTFMTSPILGRIYRFEDAEASRLATAPKWTSENPTHEGT